MTNRRRAVRDLAASVRRIRLLHAELGRLVEDELGMSVPQVQALDAVATGARQISEVAAHACAHVSSASRVVDQLVRDGLVDRSPDPSDRRAVVLSLTAAGTARLGRLEELHVDLLDRFLAGLDDDEVVTFARLHARFVDGAVDAVTGATTA